MTTQYANASYQEIIDIKTEADKTSIIGIHTPNDSKPVNMLRGFWEQFRQFKYNGCSIQLVPAARLPADISQVGYGAGEAPIDMRDILNPILFKGCHGDDLGIILNQALNQDEISSALVRADSTTEFFDPYESLYYRALTDNSWRKADPQRGFRKSGLRPLVHTVVSNRAYGQFAPGTLVDASGSSYATVDSEIYPEPEENGTGQLGAGTISGNVYFGNSIDVTPSPRLGLDGNTAKISPTYENSAFFTNRLTAMSWQDTHSANMTGFELSITSSNEIATEASVFNLFSDKYAPTTNRCNTVPLAYMGVLILPPAYKAEQYFRMIINHSFSFRRFRGVSMAPIMNVGNYSSTDNEGGNFATDGGYYDAL